jgi:hypothetical protein
LYRRDDGRFGACDESNPQQKPVGLREDGIAGKISALPFCQAHFQEFFLGGAKVFFGIMIEIFPNPKLSSILLDQLFLATFLATIHPFRFHPIASYRSFGLTFIREASIALRKRSSKPGRFKEAG